MIEQVPQQPIIVFDGVCVLCSRWVRFLLKHDGRQRYRFASMQSDAGHALLRDNGLDPLAPQSLLVLDAGRNFTDSDAIVRVLKSLDANRWTWLANAILMVPRVVRDPLYRFIARHRYRLFGRRQDCLVPTPEHGDRFIS